MKTCPCEYRKASFAHGNIVGYWVTLWLLVEPSGVVHSFLHQSDMVDNVCLAREAGVDIYVTKIECLCTPTSLGNVYSQIVDFENGNK